MLDHCSMYVNSRHSFEFTWRSLQGTAYLDFINLELSDTNIVDHHTHSYNALGLTFSVQPAREAPDSIWWLTAEESPTVQTWKVVEKHPPTRNPDC